MNKIEQLKTYVKITFSDGGTCVCYPNEVSSMTEGGGKFTAEEIKMTEAEFETLPEFEG